MAAGAVVTAAVLGEAWRGEPGEPAILVHGASAEGVPEPMKPMVGSFADCCARSANGQAAAAPPISEMNSRRCKRSSFMAILNPRADGPRPVLDIRVLQ